MKWIPSVFLIALATAATCTTGFSQTLNVQHDTGVPNISFKAEKRRLDIIAVELKKNPDKLAYLIAYKGPTGKRSSATIRLSRSKQYLIKSHGIRPERIITVYGGSKPGGLVMMIYTEKPS